MIKISNFCGIFATLFVTTTMVLLASCSQDDDNYDSDMYTLAEMGTRLGGKGDPGEGGGNRPKGYTFSTSKLFNFQFIGFQIPPRTVQIDFKYTTPSLDSLLMCNVSCEDEDFRVSGALTEQVITDNAYIIAQTCTIEFVNDPDITIVNSNDTIPKSAFSFK